jgi:hypothetical protein
MFLPACLGGVGVQQLSILLLLGVLIFGRGLAKLCGFARPTAAPTAPESSSDGPIACAAVDSASSQQQGIPEHVSA